MAITEWALCRTAMGQSNTKILLCDDDPAFLAHIRAELARIFTKLNLQAEVTAFGRPADIPAEALASCHMAFLDIDFEDENENGMDIARRLRAENAETTIFFVTNFIEYAPEGYEVRAFRYVLKRDMDQVLERYILQAMEALAEGREYLQLRDQEQLHDLPLAQIAYIEVQDHYVSIHAATGDHTMAATLSSLEKALEDHGFLRIHKSYLVNMAHIRKFRSRECLLSNGTALAVSEKNYAQQKQKYLTWKGLK